MTPRQASFLSLQFAEKRSYYQGSESIPVKIYALKAPKKSYSLKLCHMPLESYSHIERILSDDMTGNTLDTLYSIISGSGVYSCTTKQIDLSGTGYVSEMDLKNFTAERNLTPGNYILGFTNKTDIIDFQKPVVPILFTVMNSHITMKVDASGKTMFLITDISTGKPLANQEITVMRNITRTYHERWNSTTNETDREYTPVTSQAFASGMILGRTNDQGFLDVNVKTLI